MDEVKKIGDYSVKYSMYIGHKDIALGENPNADKDERYMCCFVENNAIFERYSEVLVSDDFAEIAKAFGQRVADAAEKIIRENESAGGFGAQANARGRTCYCISLYDGRRTSFYRSDILGVIEPGKLPEWAQKGLLKAREIYEQENKPPKVRGDAR